MEAPPIQSGITSVTNCYAASASAIQSGNHKGVAAVFVQNSEEHLNANAALCKGGIRRAWSVVGNLWAGGWWVHPNGRGGGWQRLK